MQTIVYVVSEILENDGINGTPIAVYHSREQANAYCKQYVQDLADMWSLEINDDSYDGLAYFEADAPESHRRSSAIVTKHIIQ